MNEKIITVVYHFVSGKEVEVTYTQKIWEETVNFLRSNLPRPMYLTEEFGMNYSLVTHYSVKS